MEKRPVAPNLNDQPTILSGQVATTLIGKP
jgi:hypothetical protein